MTPRDAWSLKEKKTATKPSSTSSWRKGGRNQRTIVEPHKRLPVAAYPAEPRKSLWWKHHRTDNACELPWRCWRSYRWLCDWCLILWSRQIKCREVSTYRFASFCWLRSANASIIDSTHFSTTKDQLSNVFFAELEDLWSGSAILVRRSRIDRSSVSSY